MKKYNVLFVPDWRAGNPYMDMLASGVSKNRATVNFADYPDQSFKLNKLINAYPESKVIHIHWVKGLVNDIIWSSSKLKFYAKYLLLLLDCVLCKLRGVRLVWTVHNLVEHETAHLEREIYIRRMLARVVDAVIVHSDQAVEAIKQTYSIDKIRNVCVIPHGNYVGMYHENVDTTKDLKYRLNLTDQDTVLLFFGSIRPYKGLEKLIPVIRSVDSPNLRLVIAGRSPDQQLTAWLQDQSQQDSRIINSFGFVADEEVASYFALADAVILPFERTLTSGSVLLAMTMSKCLLLPEEARVLGLPGDSGAFYFDSDDECREAIHRVLSLDTKEMGRHNFQKCANLSWDWIGKKTIDAYGA